MHRTRSENIEALERRLAALHSAGASDAQRAVAGNDLAWALVTTAPQRALEHSLKAQETARRAADQAQEAYALRNQAASRYQLGEYEHALSRAIAALNLFEELGDRNGQASALGWIGNIHFWLGDYGSALEHHYRSLRLSEETVNRALEGDSLSTIASIYARMGDHGKALDYCLRSLNLRVKNGDRLGEAVCLDDLGMIYFDMGALDKARDYHQRSLTLYEAENAGRCLAPVIANLGRAAAHGGDPDQATTHFNRGLALARQHDDRRTQAACLIELGRLHGGAGRASVALECLRAALAIELEAHRREPIAEAHLALATVHEQAGDLAQALFHHKEMHRVKMELMGEAAGQRTRALQVRLEVDKTQQENMIYHLKNVELATATRKLEALVQALNDVNEQKTTLLDKLRLQAEELDRQANHDSLTGLYNRRQLGGQLIQEFSRARRFRRALAVVMADVDNFKQINDRFSHLVGDEVLKTLAQLFRQSTRSINFIARYGGEEFVLIFPETNREGAAVVCERIREAVAAYEWNTINPGLTVTLSLGISDDTSVDNHEKMLALADAKLYEAKMGGRNQVRW